MAIRPYKSRRGEWPYSLTDYASQGRPYKRNITIHYSLFTIHYSLFTIHYSLFPTPQTLHDGGFPLHPTPYTLHPTPYTPHPRSPEAPCHNPYLASTFRKVAQASTALSAKLANSKNRFNSLRNKFLSTSKASRFKFAGVTMVSNKVAYSFPG